jgi:hypothetical protein
MSGETRPEISAALNMAIKACEKQVPKKPIIWENRHYFSPTPNDDWGYECPCCGNDDIDYPQHHCECGQALDWDALEEYWSAEEGHEETKEYNIVEEFEL